VTPEIPPSTPTGSSAGQSIPLECRLAAGAWQPCTMTVLQLGEHWWLQVGNQRLEFRSDGRGSVSLRSGTGVPRSVQPVWSADQALCWDGVCAKGNLPLD
jgi:hypothetical protein